MGRSLKKTLAVETEVLPTEPVLIAKATALEAGWDSLGTPRSELTLDFTLPTGQSFRWRRSGDNEYTGVLNQRLVKLRQEENDVLWQVLARAPGVSAKDDAGVLYDYFNLHTAIGPLSVEWAAKDPRFAKVHPYFPGARMLRQDPVECLFQFICSSNNHISRIHGMVERLCSAYGTPLVPTAKDVGLADGVKAAADPMAFYAFPTLEQLSKASEDSLRAAGFGYRAKFITGSVAALLEKEEGGVKWLRGLRDVPYQEASAALTTLPGIGPKVAACICLFSLDKHEAIPVDTHVWQLATRFYTPNLKGKTYLLSGKALTPKLMTAVEAAIVERFGCYAGWAHNILFISDLASQRHHLPPHLQPAGTPAKQPKTPAKAASALNALAGEREVDEGKAGKRPRKRSRKAEEVL